MKHRFIRRAGLRRLTARLPTAAGRSLELLVTASPYLIEALKLLQRRYRDQSGALQSSQSMSSPHGQSIAAMTKPDTPDEDHASPGSQAGKPASTLPRYSTAHAADPVDDPARGSLPAKRST